MRAAIYQLDAALADWRTGMADAAALAVAAASVLDAYAWDRADTFREIQAERTQKMSDRIPDGYTWPTFNLTHQGETYTFGVHLVRDDDDGSHMFVAFRGDIHDHDRRVELLRTGCERIGSRPMPLIDGGVPETALQCIAKDFHEHPEVGIVFGPAHGMDASSN